MSRRETRPLFPDDDPRDTSVIARRIALLEQRCGAARCWAARSGFAGVDGARRARPAARPGGRCRRAGAALPDDAAPPDQQVSSCRTTSRTTRRRIFTSRSTSGSQRRSSDILSDPLVRLNRDFEIIPAGALEWSGNEDGTVWTFKLDPNADVE